MFGPMWDPKVAVVGIPSSILVAGIGLGLLVIGFLWLRNVTKRDPEPDSFWATARRGSRVNVALVAGLSLAGLAALVVVLLRA
jgi:putative copper export protein